MRQTETVASHVCDSKTEKHVAKWIVGLVAMHVTNSETRNRNVQLFCIYMWIG